MTDYLLRGLAKYKRIHTEPATSRRISDFHGGGYLGGDYPFQTKVEGVPTSVEIRVLWRGYGDDDGYLVATTMSKPDGTWRVDNLSPNLKYDVVARRSGFNDLIMTDVAPIDE